MTGNAEVEDLLRPLAPQVLGVLVRRYGRFDVCEDAVQERSSRPPSGGPGSLSPTTRGPG